MQLLCLGMSVSDSESQWFNLLNSSNIHIQFIYDSNYNKVIAFQVGYKNKQNGELLSLALTFYSFF